METFQPNKDPLIIFDGVCHLCQSSVQWVLKNEKKPIIYFTAFQSAYLLQNNTPFSTKQSIDSIVFIEDGKIYRKYKAVHKISKYLKGYHVILYYLGFIVPTFIGDFFYSKVAENRYQWWGKSATCWMPKPEWKHRFLL
ncbi:MAG: DCC1-like thiol-disulfide oxidoreductase family protein [Cytophagaceae bacterium]|jgi:predicted DCC family thiol-disulfide oxidoreductase YuxK|nr:DCC1-like thiol-disulfide oxidoreductase family protein [Cytophagaceae bacterium]